MASVTLLLAHLDSYRHPFQADMMTHLYLGDRAMIEEAQENLLEVSRLNDHSLSRHSAELLRRLLAIEAEAAGGYAALAHSVVVQQVAHSASLVVDEEEEQDATQMYIPYFSLIKFAMEGMAARATRYSIRPIEHIDTPHSAASLNAPYASVSSSQRGLDEPGTTLYTQTSDENDSITAAAPCCSAGIETQQPGLVADVASVQGDVWNPRFSEGGFFDSLLPGLTGDQGCSLEGIVMGYFERLMAGST